MLTSFDTIKLSMEKALTDIEKANILKNKGNTIFWVTEDFCEDIDLYVEKRKQDLVRIVEYINKNA